MTIHPASMPYSHNGIGDASKHSVGNDLEVRLLHTAFADE